MNIRTRWLASAPVVVALAALTITPAIAAGPSSPGPTSAPGPSLTVDPPRADGDMHHPLLLETTLASGSVTPLITSGTPAGYTPAQIKSYLGLTGTGSGQTIAIVTAYNAPTVAADLATFDATFGLPAPYSFKKVSQSGSTTSLPAADAGWALEASLDVEWAHAVAPAASLLLVEATTSSLSNLDTAIAYAAKQSGVSVISNSWGSAGEISGETTMDTYCKLTKAVCVFSSGDAGNPGGYPAYNPYVLSVGGTTLWLSTTNGVTSVSSEAAWSGSGGGVSIYETKPSYQSALSFAKRTIPDVSYDADPTTGFAVYDSTTYNNASGWFQMGGTSAGAPQWAGILAAANQLRVAKRKAVLAAYSTTTTNPTPADKAVYAVTTNLSDITSGAANGSCSVCTVTVGYDAVTGLGSPRAGIDVALAAQ